MNASQLLNIYKNDCSQLVSTYNNNILNIKKLKIVNKIKQYYINNLIREFNSKLVVIKKKYQDA